MIREGRTEKIPSYIQSGRDEGMITMDHTLKNYVEQKLVTGEEVYMFAQDKTLFEQYFSHEVKPSAGKPSAPLADKPAKTPAPTEKPDKPAATTARPDTSEKPVKAPPPAPEKPAKLSPSQEGWG